MLMLIRRKSLLAAAIVTSIVTVIFTVQGLLTAGSAEAQGLPAPIVRAAQNPKVTIKYAIQLPVGYTRAHAWPVILFLHGSGEMGDDGTRQTTEGIGPAIARHPERFPAVVVMPQSPGIKWVENYDLMNLVFETLDNVVREFNGDRNRLYLTGLSMGGGGTWVYGAHNATILAAMLPIQGFGKHSEVVPPLNRMPIWAFHGNADMNIPVQKTRDLVAAVRAEGNPNVKYTEFDGADHFIWDRVYDDPAVISWLFSQSLAGARGKAAFKASR